MQHITHHILIYLFLVPWQEGLRRKITMPKRGYGWSKRGTKASRRRERVLQRSSRFYAVAHGRREGLFDTWDDANKQVFQFSGALHKSFKTLEEAFIYMYENRLTPPAERELWPWMRDTPKPNAAYEEFYLAYWAQKEREQEGEFDG